MASLSHNEDLLDYREMKRAKRAYAVLINKKWYALSSWISAQVLEWTDGCIKDSNAYARLSPSYNSLKKPSGKLFEDLVISSDNEWWKKLTVFRGSSKGYVSEILQSDISNSIQASKD